MGEVHQLRGAPAPTFGHAAEAFLTAHASAAAWAAGTTSGVSRRPFLFEPVAEVPELHAMDASRARGCYRSSSMSACRWNSFHWPSANRKSSVTRRFILTGSGLSFSTTVERWIPVQ